MPSVDFFQQYMQADAISVFPILNPTILFVICDLQSKRKKAFFLEACGLFIIQDERLK